MTSAENLKLILESMPQGTDEVTHVVLKSQARRPRKSLWGVKSRVSGKNRKGQVAHGVGNMDTNIVMVNNGNMAN